MAGPRDDIVITPGVEGEERITGPRRGGARGRRGVRSGRGRGLARAGLFTARGRAAAAISRKNRQRDARRASSITSRAFKLAGKAALSRAAPGVVAVIAFIVVAHRLTTDNPIEGWWGARKDEQWGEASDDARATMLANLAVRNSAIPGAVMTVDMAIGDDVAHSKSSFDGFKRRILLRMKGRKDFIQFKDSEGKNPFTSNSVLEQLATRGKNIIVDQFWEHMPPGFTDTTNLTKPR